MTVSLNFRTEAFAQDTGIVPIALMTIDHATLTTPILLSSDATQRIEDSASDIIYGTISRGDTYIFLPMSIKLPDDTDDGPRSMILEFDNVLREHIEIIRSIVGQPTITTEFVLSNDLETVEAQWPEFVMTAISYNAGSISCQITAETLSREPIPAMSFDPARTPGLFDVRR